MIRTFGVVVNNHDPGSAVDLVRSGIVNPVSGWLGAERGWARAAGRDGDRDDRDDHECDEDAPRAVPFGDEAEQRHEEATCADGEPERG